MEYYKNSTRYVKFFLTMAILSAISATFFFDQIDAILHSKQNQDEIMALIEKQQVTEQNIENEEQKELGEKEYVDTIVTKYKEKYPNTTREQERELVFTIRNKYREEHNLPLLKREPLQQEEPIRNPMDEQQQQSLQYEQYQQLPPVQSLDENPPLQNEQVSQENLNEQYQNQQVPPVQPLNETQEYQPQSNY